MRLNPKTLSHNRIHFESTEELEYDQVPEHLKALYNVVLDFNGIIQTQFGIDDNQNIWDITATRAWQRLTEVERSAVLSCLKDAQRIQNEALKLEATTADEKSWSRLFDHEIFTPLYRAWQPIDSDSRSVSRQKYFYDSFEYHGEKYWNLFDKRNGFRAEDRFMLSKPKPDWAFYFTIHDTRSRQDPTRSAHRWAWKNTPQEKLIANFSLDTLERLWEEGDLQFCPLVNNGDNSDKYRPKDLQCFPWLVVEHKGNPKEAMMGYCQAANATSAALMLLQSLAQYAEDQDKGQHVPPVLAITTVAQEVKVWISWYHPDARGNDQYEMAFVWSGDATDIKDILKLQAILENIHIWAVRCLKPLISTYVDQWLRRYPEGGKKDDKKTLSVAALILQQRGDISKSNLTSLLDHALKRTFDRGYCHTLDSNRDLELDSLIREVFQSENGKLFKRLERLIQEKWTGPEQKPKTPADLVADMANTFVSTTQGSSRLQRSQEHQPLPAVQPTAAGSDPATTKPKGPEYEDIPIEARSHASDEKKPAILTWEVAASPALRRARSPDPPLSTAANEPRDSDEFGQKHQPVVSVSSRVMSNEELDKDDSDTVTLVGSGRPEEPMETQVREEARYSQEPLPMSLTGFRFKFSEAAIGLSHFSSGGNVNTEPHNKTTSPRASDERSEDAAYGTGGEFTSYTSSPKS